MDNSEVMWSDNLAQWNSALDRNSYFTGKAREDKQKSQIYCLSSKGFSTESIFDWFQSLHF
jgi:hypothetical protein